MMHNISEPTLLLRENICKANIQKMSQKAENNGLRFKPHMKTHQSAEIGEWLRKSGVEAITVSSVTMAEYFADHGWSDITIAFPCNTRQIDRINELAEHLTLTLLVNNLSTAKTLDQKLKYPVRVYIEIDTGSGRTGLSVNQMPKIKQLINYFKETSRLEWIGFYSHPGHSYGARSEEEIQAIHESVKEQCIELRDEVEPQFGNIEICIGDTPCCSKGSGFESIDAISPGNFMFYDLMQVQIGSCEVSDIAVAMSCPVVDTFPDRHELAIHGGAIHFSKELLSYEEIDSYGLVASEKEDCWEILDGKTYLKSLSQEHGIVKCSKEAFEQFKVGDMVTILPVHSCLTANLMKTFLLSDGTLVNQMGIKA